MRLFRSLRLRRQEPVHDHAQASALIAQGNVAEDTGQLVEARRSYLAAIKHAPDLPKAHLNLGNVLLTMNDFQGAIAAYSQALTLDAGYAPAHYNLGNVYFRSRQFELALGCYRKALSFKSDFVDAEVAQGNTQDALGQFSQAIASYRRALALQPNYFQVYVNLAGTLYKHNDLGGALDCLEMVLAAQPGNGGALALAYQLRCHLAHWAGRSDIEAHLRALVQQGVPDVNPFSLLTLEPWGEGTAALQLQAARQYAQKRFGAFLDSAPVFRSRVPGKRLRIAYLSADFQDHATMRLLRGVLAAHDHEKFSIHGYSYGPVRDAMTTQVQKACDVFRDLAHVSDREAAEIIAADEVDILVDLKGYTAHARLEIQALRPAPVLVSWLGYPGTLGHSGLADYLIGDSVVTPPEHAAHFSETLALMPHSYQPNDRDRAIGSPPSREQVGLPGTGAVFCSFNQSYKLSPQTLDLWCQILNRVPDSVLWILAADEVFKTNFLREVEVRGIPAKRVVFCASMPSEAHLGRLQLADLALDSYPCTSHTTASDALWVGLPMPTRLGPTFASRVAASLLQAAGVPELITHSERDYVELVTALALDPRRLQILRDKLIALRQTSPLFDTVRFARDLERLYERIWAQHGENGREPIVLESHSLEVDASGPP
jgi:predicted O-linked N-acetylglucosamine transferase (SPINDLY family)